MSNINSSNSAISVNVPATLSVSIGARFANEVGMNETVQENVNLILDSVTNSADMKDIVEFLLRKGIYSFAAEIKGKATLQTPEEFKELVKGIDAYAVLKAANTETKRGRQASEYPQAMRSMDVKTIRKYQLKMLEREELVKLPRGFEEWAKEKIILAELAKDKDNVMRYINGLNEKIDDISTDAPEKAAIRQFTDWVISFA